MKTIKNNIHRLLLLAILSLTVVSCNLDEYPEDSLAEDRIEWNSTTDVEKVRMGIYALYRQVNGGNFTTATDYQVDLFNATVGYNNTAGDLYRWDFTSSQGSITQIWASNYKLIGNINYLLMNIDKVVAAHESEQAYLKNTKGEAHLLRAIAYHTLALRFAPLYQEDTAEQELGLPLEEVVDIKALPARATLEETYQFILKDLAQARALLSQKGKHNAEFMTVDVLDAFEARVALSMSNYSLAMERVETLADKYPLSNSVEEFAKMWLKDTSSEVIYRHFASVDERLNEFDVYLEFDPASKAYSPLYVPNQWVIDLYEDEDMRKDVFFVKDLIKSSRVSVDDVYMLNKFPGNPDLQKIPHEYYHKYKPFRIAEIYLIAAESAFMLKDEAKAASWLNKLRQARAASEIKQTGEDLFKAIQEEWVREFIGEGMRLNQLARWEMAMDRSDKLPQNPKLTINSPGFSDLVIPSNSEKFVWEIPYHDLDANKNIIPNWKNN